MRKLTPSGHLKITVSLPLPLVQDLETIGNRLHITRSALLASLLQEPIRDLVRMTDALVEDIAADEKIRRFRGESINVVASRIAEFNTALESLQPAASPAAVLSGGGAHGKP